MAKTRRTGWPPGLQLLIQLWGQAKGTAIVSPIYLPGSDGETMETVADLIFLGSKISVDGDYSHVIKRSLLLGRKAMINLEIIKAETLLSDKSLYNQIYGFSSSHVWM